MSGDGPAGTRVVLRPLATPLPLGFLALVLATTAFAAVQLGWVLPADGRIAGLVAVAATVPLQLLASVIGFLARDPSPRPVWVSSAAPGPSSASPR